MSDADIVFKFSWAELGDILGAYVEASGKLPASGSVHARLAFTEAGAVYTVTPLPNVTVLDTQRKPKAKERP